MSLKRLRSELESRQVFKAWEIEENLDRYFFRPVAVVFTAAFLPMRVTPDQVSVAGMLIGMGAAFLMFSPSVPVLATCVALLWIAEVMDAADGQLARLRKEPSRYGRIVDGVCSMLMFVVIYSVLGWGLVSQTGEWMWGALAFLALASHSLQSALYDFYRTEYIRIVKKREALDPDSPEALARARRTGADGAGAGRGLVLGLYEHYAARQVWTTPTYQPLLRAIQAHFPDGPVSEHFAAAYGERQRRMVRWWNYLGPNAHLVLLSASVLLRRPEWYLWANVLLLNVYALALTWTQRGASERLIQDLSREEPDPRPVPVRGGAMAEAK
ncbi:MAG: CDP-alcohol phosphatidyltransferase family protein [Candidatus Eisenbacteria bacterium]|nr:CDP-alcohol phosphatidyltransferase family protein [Candidatus Eisenbacteria bacterium]